jgi:hypothetical protein
VFSNEVVEVGVTGVSILTEIPEKGKGGMKGRQTEQNRAEEKPHPW